MTEPNPLVTVYLVNHNYGRFIGEAIESIFNQTMTNYECLIIDDGSTDHSRQIIDSYAKNHRLFTIYQQNRGLTVSNNIALRTARGKFIMRLDADDYLDPHCLELLSNILNKDPNIAMAFPDYFEVSEEGKVIKIVRRHNFDNVTVLDQPAHGACTMIRRDVLEEIGGYDESFGCQDGWDIWVRIIDRWQVKNINLPLFYYRQHERSLTRNESRLLTTRAEIFHRQNLEKRQRTIAIIPTRGSVTDPNSIALLDLGDRKVIDWTIDAAFSARQVDDVVVTTPDDTIIEHVRQTYGDRVICVKRDADMARLNSFTEDVLRHALLQYELSRPPVDVLVELFVEAPFRQPSLIDAALNALVVFGTERTISARPDTGDLYWHRGNGLESIRGRRILRLESEDIYRDIGAVSAILANVIRSAKSIDECTCGHVIADVKSAFTIMTEWDFRVANLIVKEMQQEWEQDQMPGHAAGGIN